MNRDLPTPVQRELCLRVGVEPFVCPADLKAGVARNVSEGIWPLNGLRHSPDADTCGWFIWAGEILSDDPLPFEFVSRFTTPKGGSPSTWGDAVLNRIGNQSQGFQSAWPSGSPIIGWDGS